MAKERQSAETNLKDNPVEHLTPITSLLDLSPIQDRKNFHQTLAFLNEAREKFEKENWRGGIESGNGRYTFADIEHLVIDIYKGDISPHLVSANEKLAFAEASKFAGVNVSKKHLARLHERAEREEKITHTPQAKKPPKPNASKQWVRKLALTAPPAAAALAFVVASKPWEAFQSLNDNLIVSNNEPRVVEVSNDNQSQGGLSNLLSQVGEKVESITKIVPNVEGLESSIEDLNLWGFDLNDPENPLTISWDSSDIVTENYQESLAFTVSPIEKSVGNRLSTQCYTNPDMECSISFDGFIVTQVHSSLNRGRELAIERVRSFLEGGIEVNRIEQENDVMETREVNFSNILKPEEREAHRLMLERNRPTLEQGEHEAKAQVAIVRIEEKYVWPNLYDNLGLIVEEALKTDPTLSQRINLERPFAAFFTCGWRLPGDERSPENISWYSSSMYLFFVGEAATGDLETSLQTAFGDNQ